MMPDADVRKKTSRAALLPLLALPAVLLSFHMFFTVTVDDGRFLINTDPDYAYLLSAIDLSRLGKSRMVMHPGTTVQWLSHWVMKARFLVAETDAVDFATSVLKHPQDYLNLLHHAFSMVNIGLLWLLGLFVYRGTRRLRLALLFQSLPCLFAPLAISGFRKVSSDIVLLSACLVLAWILLKAVHHRPDEEKIIERFSLAIALGLVLGFGMATKITFAVMALIPLVLIPSLLGKALFLLVTGAVFWLFTLPIFPSIHFFGNFLLRIVTHRGIYGHGPSSLFNWHDFRDNMLSLSRENFPFILYLLLSSVVIGWSIARSAAWGKKVRIWKETNFRALVAVTGAQIIGVLMVARHFKSKYLIPALAMTVVGVYLLNRHLEWLNNRDVFSSPLSKKLFAWRERALVFFIGISLIGSALQVSAFHRQRRERLSEARMIEKKLQGEYRGFAVVYYYNAAALVYGLKFGNEWTPLYAKSLGQLYGERYFYHPSKRIIHGWSPKKRITLEKLKKKHAGRVVFYGTPFSAFRGKTNWKKPDFPLQDIAGGKGITLYQLKY
jgi:hypothetical protein